MTLSGSSSYRAEERRDDDEDNLRSRDRSPHRGRDRHELSSSTCQSSAGKQKLVFGFDKKLSPSDQKKGIQIKLGNVSVSKDQTMF